MDFDLTEDQRFLARGAREFLGSVFPPEAALAAANPDGAMDRDLWKKCAEIGFLGITVPEAQGGMGLGLLDAVCVLEEIGRAAVSLPIPQAVVASSILARWGKSERHLEWLEGIAAGDLVAVPILPGQRLVGDADNADLFLAVGEDQIVHVVPAASADVRRQVTSYGGRRLSVVGLNEIEGFLLGPESLGPQHLCDALAVCNAAVLLGISSHLLDATVIHVMERHQFDRPVGSFQAVKHRLANAYVALETARPSVWEAAYLLDRGVPTARVASAVAAIAAAQAHQVVNEHALQCHGGMGFAQENPLHVWLTLGKALERAYGSTRHHSRRLGAALFADREPVLPDVLSRIFPATDMDEEFS